MREGRGKEGVGEKAGVPDHSHILSPFLFLLIDVTIIILIVMQSV